MDVVSVLSEPETYPDWHMEVVQDIFIELAGTRLSEAQRRAVEMVEAHLASRSI